MSSPRTIEDAIARPQDGEPTYGIAGLFPPQGCWSEEEYLALETNHLVEFVDGRLEFLPMPTDSHQWIVMLFADLIRNRVRPQKLGFTRFAPLKLRVSDTKYREPDLLFLSRERAHLRHERMWEGADLVVEVVSESNRDHDWVQKKADYAAAGIREYWICDPAQRIFAIFTLDEGATEYREHCRCGEGESAESVLLPGLVVEVATLFAEPDG
jgi:Uma2 family endonuclease